MREVTSSFVSACSSDVFADARSPFASCASPRVRIAAGFVSAHANSAGLASAASIHGYTTAFAWAAALFGVGLLVALLILPADGAGRARVAQAEARDELTFSLETT